MPTLQIVASALWFVLFMVATFFAAASARFLITVLLKPERSEKEVEGAGYDAFVFVFCSLLAIMFLASW